MPTDKGRTAHEEKISFHFRCACTGTCHCCSDRSLRPDLTTYYHLTNSDEVAIVLNNEVTSSKARVIDGHIYIDYDFVHDNLNSRFYWDNNENILLYATAQNLISAQAEQTSYMVTKSSADYVVKLLP